MSDVTLTPREQEALRIYLREGELWEGFMHDAWPLIRAPRPIAHSLRRKGLVEFGEWDEHSGYELRITAEGRRAATALGEPREPSA